MRPFYKYGKFSCSSALSWGLTTDRDGSFRQPWRANRLAGWLAGWRRKGDMSLGLTAKRVHRNISDDVVYHTSFAGKKRNINYLPW